MNDSSRPPLSAWNCAAVFTALAAFYLSTQSPFVLILPVLFGASLLLSPRFDRDASSIWGVRLLVYAALALLGRVPTSAPAYFVDAQSFTTAGLIAGGELLLQSFRKPPPGARFDPWVVSLSGVIFLIACNTYAPHIWVLAPLYILFLLLSLADLRPRAAGRSALSQTRRVALLLLVVGLGAGLHSALWTYRGPLMTLGARFLSNGRPSSNQGDGAAEAPQLSSSFGGNTSTARLFRIEGALSDDHLRAATFDTYRDGTWGPPLSKRAVGPALPLETGEQQLNARGDAIDVPLSRADAKITMLRDNGGVLIAPLSASALLPGSGFSFDWNRFQGPVHTDEPSPYPYYVINNARSLFDFQVQQGPLCPPLDRVTRAVPDVGTPQALARTRATLMQIPPGVDPLVTQLARRVARRGATPAEKAALLVNYLFQTNRYSLEFVRTSQDPISDFVLNKKGGHCQFFASALTVMLRAVGIPARYASGYYAHEREGSGATIVRGRDAHAWSEAYLSGIGWVALDATPPSGRADPRANPLPVTQKPWEWIQDTFAKVRTWFGNLTPAQIAAILGIIVLLWGLERARQAWKKKRQRVRGPVPPPELAPLARRFERVLAKRGITLVAGRPWSESLSAELQREREWVEGYNRARFDPLSHDQLHALERELRELEKARLASQRKTTNSQ